MMLSFASSPVSSAAVTATLPKPSGAKIGAIAPAMLPRMLSCVLTAHAPVQVNRPMSQTTTDDSRITLHARLRNSPVRRSTLRRTLDIRGRRYGGSSITNAADSPGNNIFRRICAISAASEIPSAQRAKIIHAPPGRSVESAAKTGIFALHETKGIISSVKRRSRSPRIDRADSAAGTEHPNPSSSGMNDRPLKPSARIGRSIRNAARAI